MLLINVMYIIHKLLCAHGCSVSDAVSWRLFVKRATQHVWRARAAHTESIAKRTTPYCSVRSIRLLLIVKGLIL